MRTYRQGTNEKITYTVDFSQDLYPGDEVSSVAWTVTGGITTSGSGVGSDYAEITAEGGTEGTSYTFQAIVTTNQARKHERSFIVQVIDR